MAKAASVLLELEKADGGKHIIHSLELDIRYERQRRIALDSEIAAANARMRHTNTQAKEAEKRCTHTEGLLASAQNELERLQRQLQIDQLGKYVVAGTGVLSGTTATSHGDARWTSANETAGGGRSQNAFAAGYHTELRLEMGEDPELNWCQQYLDQEDHNPTLKTALEKAMQVAAEVKLQLGTMDFSRSADNT
jgi:hypothetical protein